MRISFVELVFVAAIALAALQMKAGDPDARLYTPPPAPALVAAMLPTPAGVQSPQRTTTVPTRESTVPAPEAAR